MGDLPKTTGPEVVTGVGEGVAKQSGPLAEPSAEQVIVPLTEEQRKILQGVLESKIKGLSLYIISESERIPQKIGPIWNAIAEKFKKITDIGWNEESNKKMLKDFLQLLCFCELPTTFTLEEKEDKQGEYLAQKSSNETINDQLSLLMKEFKTKYFPDINLTTGPSALGGEEPTQQSVIVGLENKEELTAQRAVISDVLRNYYSTSTSLALFLKGLKDVPENNNDPLYLARIVFDQTSFAEREKYIESVIGRRVSFSAMAETPASASATPQPVRESEEAPAVPAPVLEPDALKEERVLPGLKEEVVIEPQDLSELKEKVTTVNNVSAQDWELYFRLAASVGTPSQEETDLFWMMYNLSTLDMLRNLPTTNPDLAGSILAEIKSFPTPNKVVSV